MVERKEKTIEKNRRNTGMRTTLMGQNFRSKSKLTGSEHLENFDLRTEKTKATRNKSLPQNAHYTEK